MASNRRSAGVGVLECGPEGRGSGSAEPEWLPLGRGVPLCLALGLGAGAWSLEVRAGAEEAGPAVGLRPGLDLEVVVWNIQHGFFALQSRSRVRSATGEG